VDTLTHADYDGEFLHECRETVKAKKKYEEIHNEYLPNTVPYVTLSDCLRALGQKQSDNFTCRTVLGIYLT
jgi:hypothetical protein